ncbi:MAG: T9SS type A sorting domain-containing protein [Candidatus Aegiribacteria sp.]|nr:T9SS type A sorting domain-containing protein [Candidatus Aegiribacteria sp.]
MFKALLVSILILAAVSAETITADLIPRLGGRIRLNETSRGSVPELPGSYAATEEGFPMLPQFPMTVELPSGSGAVSVSSSESWETVAASVFIPPLSRPLPLIFEQADNVAAQNNDVYGSDSFWPSEPVELTGTGFMNGSPVAELAVTPMRWNPATGELQRLSSLEVHIETAPLSASPLPSVDSGAARRMLIVTDASFESAFSDLADRRNDQGILTEIYTMDEIYLSASGRDNAEKLRNFVIDYYTTNGLDFLLLGGDTNAVPLRYAYAMTCEAGFHVREDSLPCDLYFSDLDGTWDANGNDIFGEVSDNVDLHPDIFVGRATVENVTEAETFVANIAAYEDCVQDDHLQKILFLAEILWMNPYTNSAESKDYIDEEFLPDFLDITKLYQALGNENLSTTMAALNEGQNFINHDGHAWYSGIGVGDDFMGISDVNAVNSDGRFTASMYSIGCWSAAFDFDAIGEHFVTNPNGCTVGFIGNSSYGWGSPGNPCYGYSDALDHLYHDYLYSDRSLTNGELLALTKEYFIPYSQWENVYRWHQYDVNLLGDPSLRSYRKYPVAITVDCPDIITVNTSLIPVHVSGANPAGLIVCVHDEGTNWDVTKLDASGAYTFVLGSPVTGNVRVTVTGPDVRRTTVDILQATGPDPVISQLIIDDDMGYGQLSPACTAELHITLLNQGNENLTNVELVIDTVTGPGAVIQNSSLFGSIDAGNESTGSPSLSIQVDSSAVNGNVIALKGEIQSTQGNWDINISLLVYAPGLYFATYSVDDSTSGNSNGIPEPGETFDLIASIANVGMLNASSVSCVMTGYPSDVTWLSDSAFVDSIPQGSTETFTFVCQLNPGTPSPSFPWLFFDILSVTADYQSCDSLRLTVGETGISNDVESGVAGWIHSGTGDLWNISTSDNHSPDHSWHCGDSEGYDPNMDCSLFSPELILAPDAQLSFWATFDVAIYGTDGLYIIINDLDDISSDTLDYIGSGGALGSDFRGTGTGWCEWSYDLSSWEAGDNIQVEFRFCSDDDSSTGSGFYIDDISIQGAYVGSTGVSTRPHVIPVLGLPSPNPVSDCFSIPLNITAQGSWNLTLYDISGRMVLLREGQSPFLDVIEMDVSHLSSGVYFLRLSGSAEAAGRLVLLRE